MQIYPHILSKAQAKHVVGPVNGGWTVAKRLLQHERSTDGGSEGGITGALKETLADLVIREVGLEDGRLADPGIRQRLAEQELEARALSLTMRRAAEEARAELAHHNPQGRLVQPWEVAETVAWLCLPASASITGQSIPIAGGEIT